MGTTNKRYEVKNPNDPASDGQTYALYTICGVDVRELELLAGNASDLIDTAKSGKSRHVRMALLEAGGILRTRDVHKNYRQDPKPKGYKVAAAPKKAKGNGKAKTDEEILLALIKKNPGLLKEALSQITGADVKEKPAKAKAKTTKVEVKTGAKAKAKAKPKVEEPEDEDEDASDDDLLAQLTAAVKKAS